MPRSDSHKAHRFIAADITPEPASSTRRRDPVLPKIAADDMPELLVIIVATDHVQRAVLQALVDGTGIARTVLTCGNFPVAASDPVMALVRSANPKVTLVDIPADNPTSTLRTIELLHQVMPDAAIFAIGKLNQAQVIVDAMRAGAREFIERPTTAGDILDAFVRLTEPRYPRSKRRSARQGALHRRERSESQRVAEDLDRKVFDRLDLEKLDRSRGDRARYEGLHVKVGPTRPDGKPHPHAGKTGRVTKFIDAFSEPYWLGLPSALIKLDSGIEPQEFIWVSLRCLEAVPY